MHPLMQYSTDEIKYTNAIHFSTPRIDLRTVVARFEPPHSPLLKIHGRTHLRQEDDQDHLLWLR